MPRKHPSVDSGASGRAEFAATHWSVVLSARNDSPDEAHAALATLCATYWYPLYAYVRRLGFSSDDAHDLTQAFFAQVIEKHALARADPSKGRFRSFLLACMKHFIANERDRAQARRRGGGRRIISIDAEHAERRYLQEPADLLTPERLFERRWALTLLERALERVRRAYAAGGRGEQFDRLKIYLTGEDDAPSYADAARALGSSEDAAKAAVHRLRRRYRKELRQEIAQTVADPGSIDEEIKELLEALSAGFRK
jgi:DNA-directed RNA polymerase specialized sigma24 family protein